MAVRACGSVRRAARGSVPTAETEGIEYRLRRSLADRLVVAGEAPARWGGGGAKGPAHQECRFDQPGPMVWEEARMNKPKPKDKSFVIPKSLVWEAWRRVKANKGAPGVDGQALEEFEADLKGQPLQDLESDEFGVLLSAPGQGGRDPQAAWRTGSGCSACRRSRTGSRRRWWPCFWSRWWSRGSTRTPMAIGRTSRPMTRSRHAGSGAGSTTG